MDEEKRDVCFHCSCCGGPIYEGDEYWDFLGGQYTVCKECIEFAHHYDAQSILAPGDDEEDDYE